MSPMVPGQFRPHDIYESHEYLSSARIKILSHVISGYFGMPEAEILSGSAATRAKGSFQNAHRRFIAYTIARRVLNLSLPKLAAIFGNCDHTSILHGIKRCDQMVKDNAIYGADYKLLHDSCVWAISRKMTPAQAQLLGISLREPSGDPLLVALNNDERHRLIDRMMEDIRGARG
jgi:Bacterial dnaA protein helix-turn-helix